MNIYSQDIIVDSRGVGQQADRQRRDLFQRSIPPYIKFIVKLNGEVEYQRQVSRRSIMRFRYSKALTSGQDQSTFVIDLGTVSFRLSRDDRQEYINNFLFYLHSGYLKCTQKEAMVYFYIALVMESDELVEKLKNVVVPQGQKDHLWENIVYVVNNKLHIEKMRQGIMSLIERNPQFLSDSKQTNEFHQKLTQIRDMTTYEKFLEMLIKVITNNYSCKIGMAEKNLIEALIKFYLIKKGNGEDFKPRQLKALLGNNINQDILTFGDDETHELLAYIRKRQNQLKQMEIQIDRQNDQKQLRIKQLSLKLEEINRQIVMVQGMSPQKKAPLKVKPIGTVHHHKDLSWCKNTDAIKLNCGHCTCLSCLLYIYGNYKSNNQNKEPSLKSGYLKCYKADCTYRQVSQSEFNEIKESVSSE